MKWLLLAVFACFCGTILAATVPQTKPKECSNGPSYWCQDLKTAKNCGAVKHCIQTVWERQTAPEDTDNVCKICLDMVKQARDQLESNETQEELKEVFEGSCKLMILKPIVAECKALADEFIPELVDTLASQMNPQMVCSVAGLCNSPRIDALLAAQSEGIVEIIPATKLVAASDVANPDTTDCSQCMSAAALMRAKFLAKPRDEFLDNLIEVCGRTGSFSDGCAAAVITHFNTLYSHLEQHLQPDEVCHLAGACDAMFHVHEEAKVEVTVGGNSGVVQRKDDLPCELCEKLVAHLQDILVANTTETEFLQVMQGLCKQTGSFQDECLSIVNQYYGMIYNYLVKALVPSETCALAGLCPQPGKKGDVAPLMPLLPSDTVEQFKAIKLTPALKVKPLVSVNIGNNGAKVSTLEIQLPSEMQLPSERLVPQTLIGGSAVCTMCEYFLHYIQQEITEASSEAELKELVENACDHLPSAIEGQCKEFVNTYGDAVVALLAQEIDPSQLCPKLGLCATQTIVDIYSAPVYDKSTCPLCLFAVQELTTRLQDNKTEASIRAALDNLCTHLPSSVIAECKQFVEQYEEQLVDMLIADFTPQEVCVYLRLCDASTVAATTSAPEILSNEIPPIRSEKVSETAECVICEFVLSKIDNMLKNQSTETEIKYIVHGVCNKLPKTVARECNDFVTQYADLVITLLAQTMDPKAVCSEIRLCQPPSFYKKKQYTKTVEECMVCEATLGALEGLLEDPTVEAEVGEKLSKACQALPTSRQQQCKQMVQVYGPSIVNLVAQMFGGRRVCEKIGLCDTYVAAVELLGGKKCTWGPGYWCQSEPHAKSCGATKHCQQKVWLADKPKN